MAGVAGIDKKTLAFFRSVTDREREDLAQSRIFQKVISREKIDPAQHNAWDRLSLQAKKDIVWLRALPTVEKFNHSLFSKYLQSRFLSVPAHENPFQEREELLQKIDGRIEEHRFIDDQFLRKRAFDFALSEGNIHSAFLLLPFAPSYFPRPYFGQSACFRQPDFSRWLASLDPKEMGLADCDLSRLTTFKVRADVDEGYRLYINGNKLSKNFLLWEGIEDTGEEGSYLIPLQFKEERSTKYWEIILLGTPWFFSPINGAQLRVVSMEYLRMRPTYLEMEVSDTQFRILMRKGDGPWIKSKEEYSVQLGQTLEITPEFF